MKLIREKSIILIGVLLILLPATGFPRSWKSVITVIFGIVIVYLGALAWKDAHKQLADSEESKIEKKTETFTETV